MTKLPVVFRASTYLTLMLATVCMGITERDQIDGALFFYLLAALAILVAYLMEGRWVIPRMASNFLAIFILIGWLAWSRFSLSGVAWEGDAGADLLRAMLPRAGPLLSALLLAKLFRPKAFSDWWLLHALALIQVVLACVLALSSRMDRENLLFAVILGLYLLCAVWTMVIFYLYRESMTPAAGGSPDRKARLVPDPDALAPGRTLGAGPSIGWFAVAMVLGLGIFFVTPRLGYDAASTLVVPGMTQASTGFSPSVDLNNTGPLEVNDELVMTIEARDDQDRVVNLGNEMRFRGVTCSVYERGLWRPKPLPTDYSRALNFRGQHPGTGTILTLWYHVDTAKVRSGRAEIIESQMHPIFLAEPLYLPNGTPPISIQGPNPSHIGPVYRQLEPALLVNNQRRTRKLQYTQTYRATPDLSSTWVQPVPTGVATSDPNFDRSLRELPRHLQESGRIKTETERILTQARVDPNASRERKARALESYLANSNQFGYALEWRRQDGNLDPTEDFLLNVKEGHCELFASALALMLRSQGIPARVVIGFRGAEWNELTGQSEIRQYHAHAWVEARIAETPMPQERTPAALEGLDRPLRPRNLEWTWLTLDPTPAGGTAGVLGADRGGWDDELHFLQFLWESFILDYSGESDGQRLLDKFTKIDWVGDSIAFWSDLANVYRALPLAVIVSVLLFVGWYLFRHWRRKVLARRAPISVAFYERLLRLLEKASLVPVLAQTPAEFGRAVALALTTRLHVPELAGVPLKIVEQFYAVRFGGRELDATEAQTVNQDLDRLAQALR